MHALVAYASKYGSTEEIARFIAGRLHEQGLTVTVEKAEDVDDPAAYDAFVVGSAVYIGHWLKPALKFVRETQDLLRQRPTWLFSSGPLGPESRAAHDATGAGAEEPTEIIELADAVQSRDHVVFDGVLRPGRLSIGHRLIRAMPAGHALLPEGDFRQWPAIEAWADQIAGEMKTAAVSA